MRDIIVHANMKHYVAALLDGHEKLKRVQVSLVIARPKGSSLSESDLVG